MSGMHLAQLNVAHMRAPKESAVMAEFVAALAPINALADTAPGFVWRLKGGEEPDATVTHAFGDHLLINYSVWEDRESLWNFVYRSGHLPVLQRRREWFHRVAEPYSVMWWVEEGVPPSLDEGMARLERLRAEGPGPQAFTFKEFYEAGAAMAAASLPAAAEARK
ncbi:DUF3291 domain-containing protein [Spongiactinospora sp. TRM90649]|uniref:DUF3291 domain-containing protein n=1 Tax=Spongiactinospora sp. TRM90649 TaxID=3031114 RepID=UPI0023F711CF|nr:DUF3291 domain-containing protein [Spongiactinospora sp. TRM90649]MDF5753832.1 DUF3291 domain-containing protein [Spongiactinospora sp. TRM90649]